MNLWEQKLERLQQAVREHVADVDKIMKGPASYERGQKIARSIGTLEAALSESTSPASEATAASSLPGPTAKPSSPAACTPARKKRSKG